MTINDSRGKCTDINGKFQWILATTQEARQSKQCLYEHCNVSITRIFAQIKWNIRGSVISVVSHGNKYRLGCQNVDPGILASEPHPTYNVSSWYFL